MKLTPENVKALKAAGFKPEDKNDIENCFWELSPGGWAFVPEYQRSLKTLRNRLKSEAVGRDGTGWCKRTKKAYNVLAKFIK